MQKILLIGQDTALLATRAAVLEKTGAQVLCCTGADTMGIVASERPDLIVLCHSLLDGQAEMIADKIRKDHLDTKILQLVSHTSLERAVPQAGFDATISTEPARLLAYATELLRMPPAHDHAVLRVSGNGHLPKPGCDNTGV